MRVRSDTDHCTWLAVPFARKDEAKQLGARWDNLSKQWYAPAGKANLLGLRAAGFLPHAQMGERDLSKPIGPATSRAGHPVEHRAETTKPIP